VDGDGNGIDNAVLKAYLTTDYATDPDAAALQATAYTGPDGRWVDPMMLNAGFGYTIVAYKPGSFDPRAFTVTP
jgi:hypothetical protein